MLKPLHVKISEEAFELLEKMHRVSDIPKSRLVDRALRAVAKDYEDSPKALRLFRAIEEADRDLREGRVHSWEDVKDEMTAILKKRRSKR